MELIKDTKWLKVTGKELHKQFGSKETLGNWFKDFVRGYDLKEGESLGCVARIIFS